MGSEEDYVRNAREAEDWAQRSTSEEDRQSWLRIARGWLDLLRKSQGVSRLSPEKRAATRCEFPKSDRS